MRFLSQDFSSKEAPRAPDSYSIKSIFGYKHQGMEKYHIGLGGHFERMVENFHLAI
jgi:hypothetical protein